MRSTEGKAPINDDRCGWFERVVIRVGPRRQQKLPALNPNYVRSREELGYISLLSPLRAELKLYIQNTNAAILCRCFHPQKTPTRSRDPLFSPEQSSRVHQD